MRVPIAFLLAGASLAACSTGGPAGKSSSSAGSTGRTVAGTTTGTASASTSSGGSGGAYSGQVTFHQAAAAHGGAGHGTYGTPSNSASALFVAGSLPPVACPGTELGGCCYQPNASGTIPAGPLPVSAGAIAVLDGAAGIGHFMPGASGYPTLNSMVTPALTWNAGDTLTVRNAPGATVDRFTGSIVAPAVFTGLSPALGGTTSLAVSLGQDFGLGWAVAPAAASTTQVTAMLTDYSVGSIGCTVDDSAAAVVFPKTLLAHFASGDPGTLSATRTAFGLAAADNASVVLEVSYTTANLVSFAP